MSAHVLLNLLNELRKRDARLAEHFISFSQQSNNTRALMLDSIYHMTLRIL